MIVGTDELARLRGHVVMCDGGFDPIHAGHVEYFRAASELGLPVLVNVSSDDWVATKHPPLLPQEQRVAVIDAMRFVDYTHLSSVSSATVLEQLRPKIYAKGADWEGKLPAEEVAVCERLGIEIAYLDTVRDSSTRLLGEYESKRGAPA